MRPIDADEIEYLYPMLGFSAYVNEEDVEKIPTLDVVPRGVCRFHKVRDY